MDIILPFVAIFWSFAQIYLFCELGERLSKRFDEIDYELFDYEWYQWPNEIQKVLPIIMNETQTRIVLKAFGNIECSRETIYLLIA